METEQFDTPFGFIEVLCNGKRRSFRVEENDYNIYSLDDGTEISPEGCYTLHIDISDNKKGDVIVVQYSCGELKDDGGGENMLNLIADSGEYTYGFGFLDTDDLEESWEWAKEDYPDDPKFSDERSFPYAYWGNVTSGAEFHIVDDPAKYSGKRKELDLWVSALWESSSNEYAWDMISYLTS